LQYAIERYLEEDLMRRAFLILVLLALIALAGLPMACNEAPSPFTVTDDLGREVNIEKTPECIVSLAPSVTEILFALGLGDKVVGVTEACDYPEEAKDKPKVAGYYSTNLEAILDKEPDIVFSDGYDPGEQQIEQSGMCLFVLKPSDIQGVFRDIELVGDVMNEERKAAEVVDELRERFDTVVARTATAATRPTVFVEVDASDETKPWTVGPDSFIDPLISLAGGQNIVNEAGDYLQINMETVLSGNPDLIILDDQPAVTPEQVMARTGVWQNLRAVKDRKVYGINPDLISRPGPRIVDGLEEMARIIHPEMFSD
jgi:iron complex transport system substrate-binding protein